MTPPRIRPGSLSEVGPVNWAFAKISGRVAGTGPPNLFLTMGRRPGLFRGWLWFAGRLMPGGKLPRRETELSILRVAHLRRCDYEWGHHVRLGKRAGVTEVEIARVQQPADVPGWSDRDRAILMAIDGLAAAGDLTDGVYDGLRAQLGESEIVELLMLVGHYLMLATFINTLRIEEDPER